MPLLAAGFMRARQIQGNGTSWEQSRRGAGHASSSVSSKAGKMGQTWNEGKQRRDLTHCLAAALQGGADQGQEDDAGVDGRHNDPLVIASQRARRVGKVCQRGDLSLLRYAVCYLERRTQRLGKVPCRCQEAKSDLLSSASQPGGDFEATSGRPLERGLDADWTPL